MSPTTWSYRQRWIAITVLVTASAGFIWTWTTWGWFRVGTSSWLGILALTAGAIVLVHVVSWAGMSATGPKFTRTQAYVLLGVGLVGLLVLRSLVPEQWDRDSDRDEALEIAVRQLISGDSPWAVPTQMGPPHFPSPLMGGVLLGLPFVVTVGNSYWQILVWLVLGLVMLARSSGYASATVAGVLLVTSPAFISEWLFESDLLVNTMVIAIAIGWTIYGMRRPSLAVGHLMGAGVLFSLGMVDRFFFAALVPLMVIILWRVGPLKSVVWAATTGAVGCALFFLPWVLFPGSADQVMRNLSKTSSEVVPNAGVILAAVMLGAAVGGALIARTATGAFGTAAVVLALLPAWMVVLQSLAAGSPVIDTFLARTYTPIPLAFALIALVITRWPLTPSEPDALADDSPSPPGIRNTLDDSPGLRLDSKTA